jgi:uncharacterized membrane protein YcaP (DUF421 family)
MGNICCSEELKASVNFDDQNLEQEKAPSPILLNKNLCHSHLDTVKEDQNDYSEYSENSLSRIK